MELNAQKKTWETPELIVLVRGRPEEAVLAFCKGAGSGTSANNAAANCQFVDGTCGDCSTPAAS